MSEVVCIEVPMKFRHRRGRKTIVFSGDTAGAQVTSCGGTDDPVVKALARAYRWQQQLDSGDHSTLSDIARAEKLSLSFVSRLFRLNFLAPSLVEMILAGALPFEVSMQSFMTSLPFLWDDQLAALKKASQDQSKRKEWPPEFKQGMK